MPTRGERNALLFLAAVALLGAGTRSCRAARPGPSAAEIAALGAQMAAVEDARGGRSSSKSGPAAKKGAARKVNQPSWPIDLDRAAVEEILQLPGVGPVIADRILAERNARGPFGCLGALQAVKGIGPATARRLDSLVRFSGPSSRDPALCLRR